MKNTNETTTKRARRNHCYALVNGTAKREEAEQLLAVLSFCYGVMRRGIETGTYSKIVLRAGSSLAWTDAALQYVRGRLGEDVCRQHLDGGGVRVARAW